MMNEKQIKKGIRMLEGDIEFDMDGIKIEMETLKTLIEDENEKAKNNKMPDIEWIEKKVEKLKRFQKRIEKKEAKMKIAKNILEGSE